MMNFDTACSCAVCGGLSTNSLPPARRHIYLMLENQFMTNVKMDCLREPNSAQQIVATSRSRLLKINRDLAVQMAAEHPSLKFVLEVHNTTTWPRLWDLASDHGTKGTQAQLQTILRAMSRLTFGERLCPRL